MWLSGIWRNCRIRGGALSVILSGRYYLHIVLAAVAHGLSLQLFWFHLALTSNMPCNPPTDDL